MDYNVYDLYSLLDDITFADVSGDSSSFADVSGDSSSFANVSGDSSAVIIGEPIYLKKSFVV